MPLRLAMLGLAPRWSRKRVRSRAVSASSQADVRYWEMLPRTVYVVPAALPAGEHEVVVNVGQTSTPPFKATVKDKGDTILYYRVRQ